MRLISITFYLKGDLPSLNNTYAVVMFVKNNNNKNNNVCFVIMQKKRTSSVNLSDLEAIKSNHIFVSI